MMRTAPNTRPQNTARTVTTATLASVIRRSDGRPPWPLVEPGSAAVGSAGGFRRRDSDVGARLSRCRPAGAVGSSAPAIISPIRSRPTLGGTMPTTAPGT